MGAAESTAQKPMTAVDIKDSIGVLYETTGAKEAFETTAGKDDADAVVSWGPRRQSVRREERRAPARPAPVHVPELEGVQGGARADRGDRRFLVRPQDQVAVTPLIDRGLQELHHEEPFGLARKPSRHDGRGVHLGRRT